MNEYLKAQAREDGLDRLDAFARVQLETRFRGLFWTSPDVELAEDVQIGRYYPGDGHSVRLVERPEDLYTVPFSKGGNRTLAKVRVNPGTVPGNARMMREEWEQLPVSVRSILAQTAGLEVGEAGRVTFIASDEEYASMDTTKPFEATIWLTNFATRPLDLQAGMRLYRYAYVDEDLAVTGPELIESKEDLHDITIYGEEGEDWAWGSYVGTSGIHAVNGIFMRARNDIRKWIPPSNEPLNLSDQSSKKFRQTDSDLYALAPITNASILSITENVHLKLSQRMLGVLEPVSYRYTEYGEFIPIMGSHINSRHVDPGSNWPIRLELRGPTTAHSEWVFYRFYRVPGILAF